MEETEELRHIFFPINKKDSCVEQLNKLTIKFFETHPACPILYLYMPQDFYFAFCKECSEMFDGGVKSIETWAGMEVFILPKAANANQLRAVGRMSILP